MADLKSLLDLVGVSEAQSCAHLAVFPLIHREPAPAIYLTLDEALRRRALRVTEVSDGGSVPELRVVNEGEQPVLLLEGEELVGAKQNRTLNLSILVPPKASLVVPVTCVEAGRWSSRSGAFKGSPNVHYSEGRALKMEQVSRSMRESNRPAADQHQVWEHIDAKLRRMNTRSGTYSMEDAYVHHATSLETYERAFTVLPAQNGAVFAIGGTVRGAELFDSPDTLRKIFPKLVKSYALDALEVRREVAPSPSPEQARRFLDEVAAAPQLVAPGIGWGHSVRIDAAGVLGAALTLDDHVVHLAAFRANERTGTDDPWTSPLLRPSRRWGY